MHTAFALLLISGEPAIAAAEMLQDAKKPREIEIRIREPLPPQQWRRTVSGTCGPIRYEAELRQGPPDRPATKLILRVNDTAVAAAEVDRVLARVPQGLFIASADLVECMPGTNDLLAWLRLGGPSIEPHARGLEFRLSSRGRIGGIR